MPVLEEGFIIAFEGIDQSGKRTQARLLSEMLRKNGYKVNYLSFPIYTTKIGREVKASLLGRRSYTLQVQHMLLAANRWEVNDQIKKWLKQGYIMVLNRYIHSNHVYGAAKGLDMDWLKALDKGISEPKLIILIDISPNISFIRKTKGRDTHESNLGLLKKVRAKYLQVSRSANWAIVNGEMPIEVVREKVWEVVKPFIWEPSTSQ